MGGRLHSTGPTTHAYLVLHHGVKVEQGEKRMGVERRRKRQCLVGSDLSRVKIADPRYEQYERILLACIKAQIKGFPSSQIAINDLMSHAYQMLAEAGWPCLAIEDKIRADVVHLLS
jgi:hypothetical protein